MAFLQNNPLIPIRLVNMGTLLMLTMILCMHLPRRRLFAATAPSAFAAGAVLAVATPFLSENVWFVTSSFLLLYVLIPLVIHALWQTTWPSAFFFSAAVFSLDHICSMLDTLTSLFFPETLDYVNTHVMTGAIILNYTFWRLLVFGAVYLLMKRRALEVEDQSVSRAFSVLILAVSLIVNLYLNLIFQNLVEAHTFWFSFINCIMNLLISTLLLVCQYMTVRENQARFRLQVSTLLREQAREQYRISRENVEAINAKCHDLKHLLLAVKDVIDPKEYGSMMGMIDSYGAEISTNNEVLDVVFQEKNFQCRKQGIQFTCIIDGSAVEFMETTDLYILFGNLIDNAIEAVSRLPEHEVKIIQVTVRRDRGFVIITTENGYAGNLEWNAGRLRTSKTDKVSHGFGMLSIERIVKKYGGRYSISTEDQIFCMNIVLPSSSAREAPANPVS